MRMGRILIRAGAPGSYEYRSGTWHKLAEDIDLSEIETDITDLERLQVAGPHASAGFTMEVMPQREILGSI